MENIACSRFSLLVFVFCATISMTVATTVPSGFILDVKVECGATSTAIPKIVVVSDLALEVEAFCENGKKTVLSTDGANYIINGSYTTISTDDCQFTNRDKSSIYTADVSVAYGLVGSTIQQSPQFYTLTCTFDQNGKEETEAVTVVRGFYAPVELRVDAGAKAASIIALDVYNVRDEVVTGDIIRGCKVYIGATTDATDSEVGLRPTACDAINPSTSQRLPILRAGCGTGLILPKDSGFTTDGLSTQSPYFEAIEFEDEAKIQFECVFTLCESNCDGDSCSIASKKKRSAVENFLGAVVRSKPSNIKPLVL
ncbi:hypothetical protein LOTGIDRAFT_229196 [Lottia gigantea]|uniref:ZP domain-containing protein n=1 Tax=Lottia gigantea TaxID=225164 RepID=V4BL72_LOTGI|nr:hypothetical protein LOTGIDRAFT_229196 [Lottia gigantea]ESO89344.1 hypothetical protein LOTGIDRAFT_229196 [Lottia gigantea]